MDGAFMAFGLPLSEFAPVEPRCCVCQQLPALFTKFLFFVFFKAPQFYHMSDCGLLPFNSFHYLNDDVLVNETWRPVHGHY